METIFNHHIEMAARQNRFENETEYLLQNGEKC